MSNPAITDVSLPPQQSLGGLPQGQNDLIPPRELIDGVGGGDFLAIGQKFFRQFTEVGGLKPHHRVLDVGCGCGRMAVPMIPYLAGGGGAYHGFDIVPEAIQWSQEHISGKYPRFHFALADIYNKLYNPRGKVKSTEYRFDFPDCFFDFAVVTSVFTHLLVLDMERYLSETARTLKPGGRCMATFFLLNDDAKSRMGRRESSLDFKYPLAKCVTSNRDVPEAAVAYEEEFIRQCFAKRGLRIIEPIRYGFWSGRENAATYQDLVLAERV